MIRKQNGQTHPSFLLEDPKTSFLALLEHIENVVGVQSSFLVPEDLVFVAEHHGLIREPWVLYPRPDHEAQLEVVPVSQVALLPARPNLPYLGQTQGRLDFPEVLSVLQLKLVADFGKFHHEDFPDPLFSLRVYVDQLPKVIDAILQDPVACLVGDLLQKAGVRALGMKTHQLLKRLRIGIQRLDRFCLDCQELLIQQIQRPFLLGCE